jgi:hypothetical protein
MSIITPARLRAFLLGVEKPAGEDGCWLWKGATRENGYGAVGLGSCVHRIAYEWMVGPIPSGMDIDHLCRVRNCVNPFHLEPVTRSENVRRAALYGPFALRRYCRRGHALSARTVWTRPFDGQTVCRLCNGRPFAKGQRHVA